MENEDRTSAEAAASAANSPGEATGGDASTTPRPRGRRSQRRRPWRSRRPRAGASAGSQGLATVPDGPALEAGIGPQELPDSPAERELIEAGEPIALGGRIAAPPVLEPAGEPLLSPAEPVAEWATSAEILATEALDEEVPELAAELGGGSPIGIAAPGVPEEVLEVGEPILDEDWVAEVEEPPPPGEAPQRVPVFMIAETGEVPPIPEPAEAPERARRRRRRERGRKEPTPKRAVTAPEAAPEEELLEAPPPEVAPEAVPPARPAPARERVRKEILVNVHDRETRIAVIEDGRLMELHIEREERVVGNVYKARVANVLPGMDAAFVDIGLERNAFLYVGDILFEAAEAEGEAVPRPRRPRREIHIRELARPGQEILVQVVKGPRGTKGARVSTKMSIPGRYLVLMPEADHLGVSRKVEDIRERERLRRIGEAIRPHGFGVIIRTEAEGRAEPELRQDLDLLLKVWNEIQQKARVTPAPALIHKDLSLILKTIRDIFGSDVDRMSIDAEADYHQAVEMLEVLSPELVSRVHLYTDPTPIFARYSVEEEIDRLLRRKVWLKSGGYLTIDSTEALTTLDVNTGKFVGTTSLADTILKTNLEAVSEVARQLRLRDIGGMIVIDFIDMASMRDRQQVMRALEQALRRDRTRTKIAHISPLGLVEMTRKRTAETVIDVMTETCPYCQGRGRVWSAETLSIHIGREIRRRVAEENWEAVLVHANPEVAAWLIGPEGEYVEQLEREIRRPVYIRARHDFHIEKYDLLPGDMMEMEDQMLPFRGGQVVDCQVSKVELIIPPRSGAWANGYFVDLANGARFQGQTTRVRLTDVRRSFALGEPVPPSTAIDKTEPI